MNKQFTQAIMKREGDKIVFIASDETLDRQGDVVSFDSWDLTNFKKNPVLLVDHDYKVENIVGTARNLKKDTGLRALTFEPNFHKITPLSQYVEQMVNEGSLSKVSVGFMSKGPSKDGGKIMNELLEISFVAVPANPNAGMMLSISDEQAVSVKSFVNETIEKEGRVLSKKSRGMIMDTVASMHSSITKLGELLEADNEEEVKMVAKTVEELKETLESKPETIETTPEIIQNLVDDSEKLSTLTTPSNEEPTKVDEPKDEQLSTPKEDETAKEALKSIARAINDTLYKMNKRV